MTVLRVLAGLLVLGAPSLAQAESWPSEVSELRVVVPKAQGKRSWGRDSITAAVRKTMAEAVKPVSANQLLKAQKKLKLRGSRALSDDGLAKAGKEAGADYVLDIKITKKKWLYTATGRLINTESGEEQMNFRSQYYKPGREGKDRGYRIAKRTIEKLAQLVNEGSAPQGGAVADSGETQTGDSDAMAQNDSGDSDSGATQQKMDDDTDGSGGDATAQRMDDNDSGAFGTDAPAPTPRRAMVFNIPRLAPNSDRVDQPDPVRELMREGFEQPAPPPPAIAKGATDDSTGGAAVGVAVGAGVAAGVAADAASVDPGGPVPVEPGAGDPAGPGTGPWGTDASDPAGPAAVEPGSSADATNTRMDDEPAKDDPTNMRMDDEPAKDEPAEDQAASQDESKIDDASSDDTDNGDAKSEEKDQDKGAATAASNDTSLASNRTSDSAGTRGSSGFTRGGETSADGVVATRVASVNDDTELLRFSVGAGSGLIRTYALRSAAVARSGLSYNLLPLSLFQASAELIVPKVPVFWRVRGALRPVGYEVDPGAGTPIEASGWLIDVDTTVGYQIKLAGSGRQAVRLSPGVGARLTRSSVSDSASDVLLSSTLVAVIGQLGLRLPINSVLEIDAGIDGGYIPLYSESPFTTGDSGTGFTVSGDLGARIWLSQAIGIAIDNRFTYEQVNFSGGPSRTLPMSEMGALTDATVSTRDLRTAFSVAVRL